MSLTASMRTTTTKMQGAMTEAQTTMTLTKLVGDGHTRRDCEGQKGACEQMGQRSCTLRREHSSLQHTAHWVSLQEM